jgi:hypothetical protein
MVIFELPSSAESASLRAVSLGSCRVRNPLYVLRDRGDLRICDGGLAATHTAAEALQALRLVRGEIQIPDALAPFVFETEKTPPTERLAQTLSGGVDVSLLEVSGDKQFTYGDILLQQNFVSRNLVQAHHGALLGWYREVCLGRNVDEDLVQASLEKLREGGFRHDEWMAELLRGLRLLRHDADDLSRTLREIIARVGGRWVVIGAITVPGEEGATMRDRREMNETVKAAAEGCGAVFFDPTEFVVAYGRTTALDAGGANINEYAESFYPILGETLVSLARTGRSARVHAGTVAPADSSAAPTGSVPAPLPKLADRVDAELVSLHRRRLEALGLEASGLYAHYRARLDQNSLIGSRERFAFDLIDAFLPPYAAYAVMRAGVGELALLLAASGRTVIAYEPNPNRRVAIEAGAAHLEDAGLLAPGLLTTVATLTPERPLERGVLGVGLDVSQFRTEASAAPHLENARRFEGLLIDLRTFVRVRESFADQMILAETLHAMGFDKRRDYPAEGLFWFRKSETCGNRQAAAPRALAGSTAAA